MQCVCSLLPAPYYDRVVETRALLAEDPLLGALYDPPFAHFSHQLAEEYDWDGLTEALRAFARNHEPFRARTAGLRCSTGQATGIGIGVRLGDELRQYHAEIWPIVSKFAIGRIDSFYEPQTIVPHVTLKRSGTSNQAFGNAMAKLGPMSFDWEFTVDSISVQCDPAHNSQTHYQRIYFPLGKTAAAKYEAPPTNAAIVEVTRPDATQHLQVARVQLDGGGTQDIELDAGTVVRLMAAAKSSTVHWSGGRCQVDDGRVVGVEADPPFPIAR